MTRLCLLCVFISACAKKELSPERAQQIVAAIVAEQACFAVLPVGPVPECVPCADWVKRCPNLDAQRRAGLVNVRCEQDRPVAEPTAAGLALATDQAPVSAAELASSHRRYILTGEPTDVKHFVSPVPNSDDEVRLAYSYQCTVNDTGQKLLAAGVAKTLPFGLTRERVASIIVTVGGAPVGPPPVRHHEHISHPSFP